MKKLSFDTGVETYDLNGKVSVSFNPTDSGFVEKLMDAFDSLRSKQEDYSARLEKMDGAEAFQFTKELDAEMRQMLDGIFGCTVCEPLFGSVNVYAMAGGFPLWMNLLDVIMDEVVHAMEKEKKALNPRMAKYLKK